MSRLMLVAAAVLISSAALAQTKDQCGTVASVLVPVISYIVPLEERVTSINWDLVIPKRTETRPALLCVFLSNGIHDFSGGWVH
jgi:hypothetical protein